MTSSTTEAAVEWPDLTQLPSLAAAFQTTISRVPDRPAVRRIGGEVAFTWGEYGDHVAKVAAGLASLGVVRGGTVGIMLSNLPVFHVVDTAALHLGATTVSIYNTNPPEDITWLLGDAGATVLITEAAFADRAVPAARAAGIEHVVLVDHAGPAGEGTISIEELAASGAADFDFEAAWRSVTPDDVVTLIYTSGTTGRPKGVELTHRAILGNIAGLSDAFGIFDGVRMISFLPMAHIAERQFTHYRGMAYGFTVTPCPTPADVPGALAEVRPHYFFSPPRLFEKFQAGLEAGLAAAPDDDAGANAAKELIALGGSVVERDQRGEPVSDEERTRHEELKATVGRGLLAKFGLDEVVIALTGSAPVRRELVRYFVALGLPLLEAWGLSECGAFGSTGRPDDIRIGTVGKPIPGVELKLEEDGEILLRGPYIMRGYRGRPEQTAEAIDADGWLLTGDIGAYDDQGNLMIVDRKKELIINASGKNMSPANIESKLKDAHPLIGQAAVIGNGRPYNVALVVLDPEAAAAFAKRAGVEGAAVADLVARADVREAVDAGVAAANEQLSRVEQIKRYALLPEEWLPSGDELTPTMKLKRKPIEAKYGTEIENLYAAV